MPRPNNPHVPLKLEKGTPESHVIRNEKKLIALSATRVSWEAILERARLAEEVPRQVQFLTALYKISLESKADIFSILVARWSQRISDERLAQEAYAAFYEKHLKQRALEESKQNEPHQQTIKPFQQKLIPPKNPPAKPEKKMSGAALRNAQDQKAEQARRAAYDTLNSLNIPESQYNSVRARFLQALRQGTVNQFLTDLARHYPRK